jgi:hypothetical protein
VLLFDRLVLPVPDTTEERHRWKHPNAADPEETWDPERLDTLIKILGSQHIPAQPAPQRGWRRKLARLRRNPPPSSSPAALTWQSNWNQQRWEFERSRLLVAENASGFHATSLILEQDPGLPEVIEAVAAFPSGKECYEELKPSDPAPQDLTAAQGLLMLAAPLLMPRGQEGKDFGPLRAAAELAREDEFQKARRAYYDWMREFVEPLQLPNQKLGEVKLDEGSFRLAQDKLRNLVTAEHKLLGKWERRRWWTRTEYALTVIGVGAAAGVALASPFAVFGVAAPIVGFGGWIAGKRTADRAKRPLGGASMFVSAQRQLGWPKV